MHTDPTDLSAWTRRGYVPLGELTGLRMASDEPDVRGWDVLTLDSQPLGQVDDLLVDRELGEIVAAVVLATTAHGARRLVFPVERLGIVEGRARTLVAEDATVDDGAPSAVVDAERGPRVEQRSAQVQEPDTHAGPAGATSHDVTVERTADEEIVRVPVVEERLVVQPVVTDTIVIRKRAVRDEQTVEADLRRERLDVERRGDV